MLSESVLARASAYDGEWSSRFRFRHPRHLGGAWSGEPVIVRLLRAPRHSTVNQCLDQLSFQQPHPNPSNEGWRTYARHTYIRLPYLLLHVIYRISFWERWLGKFHSDPVLLHTLIDSFCWAIFSQFYPFGVFVSFVFFFYLWLVAGGREGMVLWPQLAYVEGRRIKPLAGWSGKWKWRIAEKTIGKTKRVENSRIPQYMKYTTINALHILDQDKSNRRTS